MTVLIERKVYPPMGFAGEGDGDGAGAGAGGDGDGAGAGAGGDGDGAGAGAGGDGDGAGAGAGGDGDGAGAGAGGDGDGGQPAPLSFDSKSADDWGKFVDQIAGEDDKRRNQLNRFTSFEAWANSWFDAQEKIRSGQIEPLQPPGEDATDEEKQQWRELHGVPEKPEDYKVQLGEGLELGEQDEQILNSVFETAHQRNWSNDDVSEMTNAYLKAKAEANHQMQIQQEEWKKETVGILKNQWGGRYDSYMNQVRGLLATMPEEVRGAFETAVMPDGRAVFNTPEILISLSDWANKINPAGAVVPAGSGNPVKAIDEEIAELEGRMGTKEWFDDTAAQERYRELVKTKEQLQEQQKAG